MSLFIEGGDSPGPGFFIFVILAVAVLIISGVVAILLGLAGIVNGVTVLNQSNDSKKEPIIGIIKNVGLTLGIALLILVVFKLLTGAW